MDENKLGREEGLFGDVLYQGVVVAQGERSPPFRGHI